MGFKDLFRPKWKHSDWEIREKAVEALSDQLILSEIAKTDNIVRVRVAAVQKLTDQNQLAEFAKKDQSSVIRFAAVERCTDNSILVEVSNNDIDTDIRLAASARAKNQNIHGFPQSIYAKVALGSIGWTEGLTDQEMFAKEALQMIALGRLTDQKFIAEVAKDGYSVYVSFAAVEKLTDQTLLADIAESASSNLQVRFNAAKKLTDQVRAQRVYAELANKIKSMREGDRPMWYLDLMKRVR